MPKFAKAARDWGKIDTVVGVNRKLIKDVANMINRNRER